jgi:hypothetical protein
VHLTGKEYQMLELLSLRKGTTLTKEMFLNHLYGGMDEPELKIIDVFICKLRKKLARRRDRRRELHRNRSGAAAMCCANRNGGRVIMCAACSKAAGLTLEDYIKGVEMGSWPLVESLLFDPKVKTLSW